MIDPIVTVLRDRYVPGWPGREDAGPAYALPLSKALTRTYSTDAHFTSYATPNGHRLTTEAVGKVEIKMVALVLDVDCAEVHGTDQPAPEQWRDDFQEKVWLLWEDYGPGFAYPTRGGARIIYTIEPSVIATPADAVQWAQEYSLIVAHLARRYGLHADRACTDWTRLYRLPHATRTPGGKPESGPTIGDAAGIAKIWIDQATKSDVARAKLAQPQIWGRSREARTYEYVGSGGGVLFHALQARGHIVKARKHGHVAVCPNVARHSCGKAGDTSCVLYPPSIGDAIGWLHCLHASCSGMTVKDWLACFTESELESARRAAGVRSVG